LSFDDAMGGCRQGRRFGRPSGNSPLVAIFQLGSIAAQTDPAGDVQNSLDVPP
jgi:hypothetical protein